jgi:hypothetical protein
MSAWRCLLLALACVTLRAEVERIDEVPAMGLHRMVWLVQPGAGRQYWVDGDLNDDYRSDMGQIHRKPVAGPQMMKWKEREYEITFAGRRSDGTLIIHFAAGLLFLKPEGLAPDAEEIWQGTYTVAGAIGSPITFRTSPKGLARGQIFDGLQPGDR